MRRLHLARPVPLSREPPDGLTAAWHYSLLRAARRRRHCRRLLFVIAVGLGLVWWWTHG